MTLNQHTATEAAQAIADGVFSSEELVKACLTQIEATDSALHAWRFIDREGALTQAQEMDRLRRAGRPLGSLHGIPVGIGDTIDVAGMPAHLGSGDPRTPKSDATLVSRLREAGAVILGKTSTREYSSGESSTGGNPHSPACSPGDGGANAAVAAGHVPLAVDRQQAGEVLMSASLCGTFAMVPTRGMISRHGTFEISGALDRIGVAARTLEDAALLADAMTGFDPADTLTHLRPKPAMRNGVDEAVPIEPNFVTFKLPYADRLSDDASEAFAELIEALGDRVEEVLLPDGYLNLIDHHDIVLAFERARSLASELATHPAELSPQLDAVMQHGMAIDESAYAESLAVIESGTSFFNEILNEFDAIVTPATAGATAPGLDLQAQTIFTAIFDSSGLPAMTLPLLGDARNLPIGVQLVTGPDEDARLFRSARWLQSYLSEL